MNRIQAQANKLWRLLTTPDTGKTYQQTWSLTVQILKEIGLLLWLVVCLFLVFVEWFWRFGFQSGVNFRSWLNNMERTSPEHIFSEGGQALVSFGRNSLNATLSQAREQLGISSAPATAASQSGVSALTESKVQPSPSVVSSIPKNPLES